MTLPAARAGELECVRSEEFAIGNRLSDPAGVGCCEGRRMVSTTPSLSAGLHCGNRLLRLSGYCSSSLVLCRRTSATSKPTDLRFLERFGWAGGLSEIFIGNLGET